MSIVEKALEKLQQTQPAAQAKPAAVAVPRKSSHEAALLRPAPVPAAPAPSVAAPSRIVHFNFDALRANELLPPADQERQLTDEFRRIKWPLLHAAFGTGTEAPLPGGNLIMNTSSLPGEGKSFTTVNLALNIAREKDCTLLLVDADVAKAQVTELMGLRGEPGLLDVLVDDKLHLEEVIYRTQIEGLEVLPAGRPHGRAPELFASRRMAELLNQQADRYPNRIILFDTSPLLATNESQVLARLVGQVVLLVRAEHTAQAAVTDALGLLDRSKSISCVLTQARAEHTHDYYGNYERYYADAAPE
jgi:receptor protein-tyrosine kinase